MEMGDSVSCVLTDVEDQAVSGFADRVGNSYLIGHFEHLGQQRSICALQLTRIADMPAGND